MTEDDDKTRILRGPCEDEAPTRVLSGAQSPALPDEEDDDGERTRVLSRVPTTSPKPAVVVAHPGKPGDRIVFQCPNGHRIIVGKQFAGKRGKCNKCGADVQIPSSTTGKPPASPIGNIGPPPDEELEAEDPEESSSPQEESPSLGDLAFGGAVSNAPPAVDDFGDLGMERSADPRTDDDIGDFNFEIPSTPAGGAPEWSSPGRDPSFDQEESNPTAQLVARLWVEREHGGIVELHLQGGAVLLPEWYESNWSKGTHGLFASQAPDGSVTLTAVAWESVEKVVVRQLAAVPDDMFT